MDKKKKNPENAILQIPYQNQTHTDKDKNQFPSKTHTAETKMKRKIGFFFLSLLYLDRWSERAIRSSLPVGKREAEEEDEIRASN